jgi:AraC family transcriptional regulator
MLSNKCFYKDEIGNEIRISSVFQTDQKVNFQNFSAKYVVSGIECYKVNNRKFDVKQNEFLIGNKNTISSVFIDQPNAVKGICLDVSKEMIMEVLSFKFENFHLFEDFLFEKEWVIQKYEGQNSLFGKLLFQLSHKIKQSNFDENYMNKALFFNIAECIVEDQNKVFHDFKKLNAVKHQTNGRLFNFIHDAKCFMDAHFLEKVNINAIAKEAKLSEYHFIRLFKSVFQITPYHYIIQKRLNLGKELLENKISVSDVSSLLGYTDVPAFSKSFKQKFGVSPKKFMTN